MTRKGLVSSFQDYSTKDGPGLRQTVFLKRCNLQCRWCSNPETLRTGEELFFFPERITDPELALEENSGALTRSGEEWTIDRDQLGKPSEVVEQNTLRLFETVGEWIEAPECARRLLRNKAFYDVSGGGVTFSGGEPMLQADFIRDVEAILADQNVHVAIDTAGNVPWTEFAKVLGGTDLFLYDIKAADPELHKRLTGVGNQRILENGRRLADEATEIWVRMVLVPGCNDDPTDLRQRFDIVAAMGEKVTRVDVLGYHSLGVGKYRRLGRPYDLGKVPSPDQALLDKALAYAGDLGLPVHYEAGVNA
ncbi:Benzylsuccinate synthase activating enzyme [Propionicimonas sp. T2.31MG-18]|uniref:glycyl-radical enzyme activating protein n=1 Tax=Propionicimonas sp. T2.31MG-18 TaxID=3157620 RepID=UPI0035ED21B4